MIWITQTDGSLNQNRIAERISHDKHIRICVELGQEKWENLIEIASHLDNIKSLFAAKSHASPSASGDCPAEDREGIEDYGRNAHADALFESFRWRHRKIQRDGRQECRKMEGGCRWKQTDCEW